jgi:hypothetical protein
MCEVGYIRQYNVPPLSFHVTLITWYQSPGLPTSLRPYNIQEKRVVPSPTQDPMCEGEIVGVVLHQLWKGLVVTL